MIHALETIFSFLVMAVLVVFIATSIVVIVDLTSKVKCEAKTQWTLLQN